MVLSAVPAGLESFSAVDMAAGDLISADSVAMLGAVAAALGPIGVNHLGAYGQPQASNRAATPSVEGVCAAIGATATALKAACLMMDDA